jgi:hypothetical protein
VLPYLLSLKGPGDNRQRGYSISSVSTNGSTNSPSSWSGTTETSSSVDGWAMTTPATSHLTLPAPAISSPGSGPRDFLSSEKKPCHDVHAIPLQHLTLAYDDPTFTTSGQFYCALRRKHFQRAQQSILDYGASLALERRLKLVEEGNNAGTNPQFPAIEI